MAEAEQPADSSILTALYPEEAKKIAQIEMLRRQRGEMTDYVGGVRRPQGGGLLARSSARERAAQLQAGAPQPQPQPPQQRAPLFGGGTPQAQRPLGPGGMPNFSDVVSGQQEAQAAARAQPPQPPQSLAPQQIKGLGMVGGPPVPGPRSAVTGLGNIPLPDPANATGPRPAQGGLPLATGRATAPEASTPPGHPSSHEPASDAPAAAQIDPNSIEGLYQQGQELRRRAYGSAPDPEVMAQERAKADENWFRGTMMQAIGGSAFAPSGGAVLQQALKRQSELELNPEVEVARKVRALEAEAQALERRAERTQNAEDKREAEAKRIEQRQWEAREGHLNRLAQIQAAAAGRTPVDPMLPVVDPNDPTKTIYVPRSQAGGMQAGKPGGAGGGKGGKTPSEVARMNIGIRALETTMDQYEEALKEFGPRSFSQLDATKRARLSGLSARMIAEAKEGIALGALTGSDLKLVEDIVGNPTGWRGVLYGKAGLNEQLNQARQFVAARKAAVREQYGDGATTAPAAQQPGGQQPGAPKPVDFRNL